MSWPRERPHRLSADFFFRLAQPRFKVQTLKWLPFLALAGCSGNFSKIHAPAANTFVWGIRFDLKTLDPANATEAITEDVLRQFFEGLVTTDVRGQVTPCLSDRWTISSDGRHYAFHIRQGVKFSNGAPLTSSDVKFSFERVADPALSSSLAQSFLGSIAGASERMSGKAGSISGITVKGPSEVDFDLAVRQPSFLKALASPGLAILSSATTPAKRTIRSVAEMIGTGPFVPDMLSGMTTLNAHAREDYWNGPVGVKHLRVEAVQEATAAINRFRAGEIDLMAVMPADVEGIRADPSIRPYLHLTPRASTVYLQLNSTAFPALRDIRVRQALAMAIDRNRFIHEILHDSETDATNFTSISPTSAALPFNPEQAAKLLAAAGYPGGKQFPQLRLEYSANGRQNPGVEEIVTDWRTHLGIEATVWGGASAAILQRNIKGQVSAFFTGWSADYDDLDDFLPQVARTGTPENHSGMSDPAIDQLLDQIAAMPDSPHRTELNDEAERLVAHDAHIVPLYFVTEPELVSTRFTNLSYTPFGHLSLGKVRQKG